MILERNKNIVEACTFSEKDQITGEKIACAIVAKKKLDKEYLISPYKESKNQATNKII